MLRDCIVVFDKRPNGIFYSGERVTGLVKICLNDSKRILDLVLVSKGYTMCKWREQRGGGSSRHTVDYGAYEEHYKSSMSLLMEYTQDAKHNNTIFLEPGCHSFQFAATLPEDLPTSFESILGQVRYIITVKAIKHLKIDEKYKMSFTVISKCDLNCIPNCGIPIQVDGRKGFKSFFMNQGAMAMTVCLPMSGFLPGQRVPINYSINNYSRILVKEVLFRFIRIVTYTAVEPIKMIKEIKKLIVEYAGRGVGKLSQSSYNVSFIVPTVPPSTTICNLPVDIKYYLKIIAVMPLMHKNLNIRIPLTIGTIPVRSPQVGSPFVAPPYNAGPSTSNGEMSYNNQYYFDLPPPSFEESTECKQVWEKRSVNTKICYFKPKYLVFHFPDTLQEGEEKLERRK